MKAESKNQQYIKTLQHLLIKVDEDFSKEKQS
jgi:hypothetical protein